MYILLEILFLRIQYTYTVHIRVDTSFLYHKNNLKYINLTSSNHLNMYDWLVVWNMAFMTFHSVGNFIIPTDEIHDFSEGWLNHQPDENNMRMGKAQRARLNVPWP